MPILTATIESLLYFYQMAGNTFGTLFRLHTFGESHGKAIGGMLDGCPPGLKLDMDFIQKQLDRRKPGQNLISTPRKESDQVEFLSGVFEGITTGTPIGFIMPNEDQRSGDYSEIEKAFRPSHADFTYTSKYGFRDHRGGGRSSARETACRVAAGAIAMQMLAEQGVRIFAYVSQVGSVMLNKSHDEIDPQIIDDSHVRCPDLETAAHMQLLIEQMRDDGDTIGGVITGVISGCPVGLGEPVFDKLHADLGKAMLSINAVKGFELGSGFASVAMRGSEHNDEYSMKEGRIVTNTNNSGGIQGGISNGAQIYFRVAFKPVASIKKQQHTVNKTGESIELAIKGRHDPCVVPRAVPIVESMAALVIADHWLRSKTIIPFI
jgi:chorismate synthase